MALPKNRKKLEIDNSISIRDRIIQSDLPIADELTGQKKSKIKSTGANGRPPAFKEESERLFIKISKQTMNAFLIAYAQEQIKYKEIGKTLTKSSMVDTALKEYIKKLSARTLSV